MLVYPIGSTEATQTTVEELNKAGIVTIDHPAPEVTHLLLDVPSFDPSGKLRSGSDIRFFLERLPSSVTIVGGNLKHPALIEYRSIDLLQDETYLAMNAAITADCALRVAGQELKMVFAGCPVLILGWGRIGKCLGKILKSLGADVTIAARKEKDVAIIRGLGYRGLHLSRLTPFLAGFRLILNTVPEMVLAGEDTALCRNCVKIDLASVQGIAGENVIWARGLPGIHAPESSGILIAETFLRMVRRH